jgi:hypothetical protein
MRSIGIETPGTSHRYPINLSANTITLLHASAGDDEYAMQDLCREVGTGLLIVSIFVQNLMRRYPHLQMYHRLGELPHVTLPSAAIRAH